MRLNRVVLHVERWDAEEFYSRPWVVGGAGVHIVPVAHVALTIKNEKKQDVLKKKTKMVSNVFVFLPVRRSAPQSPPVS